MLRRFLLVVVADLAEQGKAHSLEPRPDREASVKNQPDERAHLPWARVVPNSGRQLSRGGVSQVEVFEKGPYARLVCGFLNASVAFFGRITKKRGVA